jgi:hypothetical protein
VAIAGREWALEAAGGRSQPGSSDPAGDRIKKAVEPRLPGLKKSKAPDQEKIKGKPCSLLKMIGAIRTSPA